MTTPTRLERLDVDGWVAIPDLLPAGDAAALGRRCSDALADVAGGDGRRIGDKTASGTRRLTSLLERIPEVATLFEHPTLIAAVAAILGDPPPGDPEVTFRNPQPGYGAQRLHADALPLAAGDPFVVVTTIVALCDFDLGNGATGVVPGSHRRPDLQRRAGRLEDHPDEIVLTGAAGTAFVFNGHLLHRGRRNGSGVPRPALQATWRR